MMDLSNKQTKDFRIVIWGSFIVGLTGIVLLNINNLAGALQGMLIAILSLALMLGVFLTCNKGNSKVALGCAVAHLAFKLWQASSLLNPGQINIIALLSHAAALVLALLMLLLALGKLNGRAAGVATAVAAICAVIRMLPSISPMLMGYSLPVNQIVGMLCNGIGLMLLTLVGFAQILDAQQYKHFTVALAIIVALVLVITIGMFFAMGGFSMFVDNAPKTPLEEAQEWVWNNFRVDSDGNLFFN